MLMLSSNSRSIVVLLVCGLSPACSAAEMPAKARQFRAVGYARTTIYHSPQSPGYTCWCGTWLMPDKSMMVSFTQATGPVTGRPKAPKEVMDKLSWYPEYDMTGLDLRNVHLRSWDGGKTWTKVSEDPFKSCMNGCTGEMETALADGTVLRAVWGHYLPYNPELPKTGYIQRSKDGSKTWGKPELMLDPKKYTAWPKRLRVLRDGRLIATGGLARMPAGAGTREEQCRVLEPMLLVSRNGGRTWSQPVAVIPEGFRKGWGGEEYDAAEMPNGDLMCVFRRTAPEGGREVLWQGVLKKKGATWVPQDVGPCPMRMTGHPELIATKDGVVLYVAPSGVSWTDDAGKNWHDLGIPGTAYYPRGVQADDGRIRVFGHIGSDNPYGQVDQSIVMDTFELNEVRE